MGDIKLISMEKFIKKLNVLTCEHDYMEFNACVGYDEDNSYQSNYVRKIIKITEGNRYDIVSSGIAIQSTVTNLFKNSIDVMAEETSVKYLEEYGLAEYFVNIAPRLWMVANTDDFIVYTNKDNTKWGVACTASCRSVIYSVSKITQKQADKIAEEYIKKHNLKDDKGSVE